MVIVGGNMISSLEPLRKLTKLEHVYVGNNNLTSLEGLNSKRIKVIDCGLNKISSLV